MAAGLTAEPCQWYISRLLSSTQPHPIHNHQSKLTILSSAGNAQNGNEVEHGKGISAVRDPVSVTPYALLILNQPLNTAALSTLIDSATYIVCADGGANKYLDYYQQVQRSQRQPQQQLSSPLSLNSAPQPGQISHKSGQPRLPTAIIGDLDSLHASTQKFFAAQGVPVIKDGDQYCTDYAKALKLICAWARGVKYVSASEEPSHSDHQGSTLNVEGQSQEHLDQREGHIKNEDGVVDNDSAKNGMDVIVLGSLGGRVDQGLSQIHHLYLASNYTPPSKPMSTTTTTTTKTAITSNSTSAPLKEGQDQNQNPYLAHPNNKIYLLSESSLSFVLTLGLNEIYIDQDDIEPSPSPLPSSSPSPSLSTSPSISESASQTQPHPDNDPTLTSPCTSTSTSTSASTFTFTENVGVIPMAGPSFITLRGFEWDVDDWRTEFGGLMSTSNHVKSDKLTVDVQGGNRCLFTIELAGRLKVDG